MTATTRTRLSPDERRSQLLDLGVRLLSTRSLDELSIDVLAEEAGISRGLLYHYFGNKHAFHEAVVRRAADDLIAQTAPPVDGEPLERLLISMTAYVDYVVDNYEGYLSLVKGAAGGNDTLREIYEEARSALTDRVFREDAQAGSMQAGSTQAGSTQAGSTQAGSTQAGSTQAGSTQGPIIADTPTNRLLVRGWSAMSEELVLAWHAHPSGVSRDELISIMATSLPALVAALPAVPEGAS